MTLRELMNQIERTNGKKLPTAAWLRMGNSPLMVEKRISENCCLSVYQNGFALYQTPDGCTVFRVDYCGGYTYFGREQETCFSEDYFAGEEWWVRLVMEGEDRLTHNRNVQIERYECSFGADSAELGDTTVPAFSVQKDLLVREALEQAFAMMTKRQKEVVRYYYIEGMSGKEIAKLYGISQQAVALTLSDVKKKLQKNQKKFF